MGARVRAAAWVAARSCRRTGAAGDRGTAAQPADATEVKSSVPKQIAAALAAADKADATAAALVTTAKRLSAQADQLAAKCAS